MSTQSTSTVTDMVSRDDYESVIRDNKKLNKDIDRLKAELQLAREKYSHLEAAMSHYAKINRASLDKIIPLAKKPTKKTTKRPKIVYHLCKGKLNINDIDVDCFYTSHNKNMPRHWKIYHQNMDKQYDLVHDLDDETQIHREVQWRQQSRAWKKALKERTAVSEEESDSESD